MLVTFSRASAYLPPTYLASGVRVFRARLFAFACPLSFSAKTGVLRSKQKPRFKQNPGFCAARAAIGRLLERFSRFFGRKHRRF